MPSEGTDKEVEILVGQGLEHYGAGELDMAIASWEEALSLRPDNREAKEYVEYVRSHYEELEAQFEDGSNAFRFSAESDTGFPLVREAPTIQGVSFARPPSMAGPASAPQVDEGWFFGGGTAPDEDDKTAETIRSIPKAPDTVRQPVPLGSLDDAFDLGALELEDSPPVSAAAPTKSSPEASGDGDELRFTLSDTDESGTLDLDAVRVPVGESEEEPTVQDRPILLTKVKPAVPVVNFNVVRISDSIDRAIELADPLESDGGPVVEMTVDAEEDYAAKTDPQRATTREDIFRADTRELSPLELPDARAEPTKQIRPPFASQKPTAELTAKASAVSQAAKPTAELRPAKLPSSSDKPTAELRGAKLPSPSLTPTAKIPAPEQASSSQDGTELEIELPDTQQSPLPRNFERLSTPEPQAGTMPMEGVARDILAQLDAGAPADEDPDAMISRRVNALLERAFAAQAAGHFPTAVVAADLALAEAPEAAVAQKILHSKERDLIALLRDYLGDPTATPRMAISMAELMSSQIDSRSAFLVSRVDGVLSFDELVDVSGMPRLEVHRHLCRLLMQGILAVV